MTSSTKSNVVFHNFNKTFPNLYQNLISKSQKNSDWLQSKNFGGGKNQTHHKSSYMNILYGNIFFFLSLYRFVVRVCLAVCQGNNKNNAEF